MSTSIPFKRVYNLLLSEETRKKSEKWILGIAISGFIIHLLSILIIELGWWDISNHSGLLDNPIAAIYTPFTFILVYEVYLLVFYLPQSITTYVSKQYEIITLIIIRRLFKDLAGIKLSSDWFEIKKDLQFTYDIVASVVLFFLLYLFYRLSKNRPKKNTAEGKLPDEIERFIQFKKVLASILVPILFGLAIYSFVSWSISLLPGRVDAPIEFLNINKIFFGEFFTLLIIVDVILLLWSFYYTDQFHKVIRNSGFIISTILIRMSFSVEGLMNTILIVSAILFGLVILKIHNLYEKNIFPTEMNTSR